MNVNCISPYIRRACRSELCAPFHIRQRIIFDYELIYVEEGCFLLIYDGKKYTCNKGDIIFIRPGIQHEIQSIEDINISQPHIHFDLCYDNFSEKVYISFKDITDFSKTEKMMIREDFLAKNGHISPFITLSDQNRFLKLLYRTIDLKNNKAPLYQLEYKVLMTELIYMIVSENYPECFEQKSTDVSLMATVKEYLENNYFDIITLEQLAAYFHYDKYYISKAFKATYNTSVMKFYNELRFNEAKKQLLLLKNVTAVSEALNFSSIYHFSRYFKQRCGLSPVAFIKENS